MLPQLPPIRNVNDYAAESSSAGAWAAATATAATTYKTKTEATVKAFNLTHLNNNANAVAALAKEQRTHSHRAHTWAVHNNRSNKSVEQQLTTLLHEMVAASTNTATTDATSTGTVGAQLPPATNTTTVAGKPTTAASLVTTPMTAAAAVILPALAPTIVSAVSILSAVLPATAIAVTATTATTSAFIQMNSTDFNDDLSSGNNATSAVSAAIAAAAAATATSPISTVAGATAIEMDSPSVDSYLIGMAWPKALAVAIFLLLILVTVVGNTLVILSVLTTRRLRTVTNCFVMNLAITDWLVGTCVMPPAVILYVVGSWRFGWILCDIWISLDVLLCTGSILSLCAISLDRYLAVTQPLTYSKKRRSKRLALVMIFVVWVTALSITCPPYLGWYEPGRRQEGYVVCRYNQNKGYVVFSAMGSFFIPLAVMLYVYLKIGYVLTSRRQRIVRDANSERTADHDIDCDNFISESEHFQCATPKFPSFKMRWSTNNDSTNNCSAKNLAQHCSKCNNKNYMAHTNGTSSIGGMKHQGSFYELVEVSRLSSLIQCSTLNCKYAGTCMHSASVGVALGAERRASTLPMQALHFTEDGASYSEASFTAATGTTASTTTTNVQAIKFNQGQHPHMHSHSYPHPHQQQPTAHHHHHAHQHPSHRIPMRVSTTKRDTKTAKTLTIVMGGFIACWLPFFVYYLLMPFLPPAAVFEGLMSFLTWVGWVNCAINPFIYAFYNPDFRTAFWRLTCRPICKQKTPPNHMAMFRG